MKRLVTVAVLCFALTFSGLTVVQATRPSDTSAATPAGVTQDHPQHWTLSASQPSVAVTRGSLPERPVQSTLRYHSEIKSWESDPDHSFSFTARAHPDQPLRFDIDYTTGALSLHTDSTAADETARPQAVKDAATLIGSRWPDWEAGFRTRMAALTHARSEELATVLNTNSETLYADEIAWVLSHAPTSDLGYSRFGADLLVENASLIYAWADRLDYVEVLELDDPPLTTLRYTLADGEDTRSWDLPADLYYRAVVNMKMDWERPATVNPTNGNPMLPPYGVFWRSYMSGEEATPQPYWVHPALTNPHDLHGDSFPDGLLFRDTVFTGFETGPQNLIVRDSDGAPVMIEFVYGNSQCCSNFLDKPDGTVLATLIPVEAWAELGETSLLDNLVAYLNGDRTLGTSHKVVLIQDRNPFDNALLASALTDYGVYLDIVGSDSLATLDLSGVHKVIVASDQPKALYQAVGDNRSLFETFVDDGGVFMLFGAVSNSADVWDGIVMPGGFTRTTDSARNGELPALLEGGYPRLADVMQGATAIWDGESYSGLNGRRVFDPAMLVLDRLGFWVGDVMAYNIMEYGSMNGQPERANQPVRIAYNHFGNCGELQDIIGAAARTMLIPTLLVHNSTEDHVWDMMHLDDRWFPFQVDWSDEATRIANPGVSYDKQQGGGKDCSCILTTEGDGSIRSVIDDYSDSITLNLRVLDQNDRPVDGAAVSIATEAWSSTDLTTGFWGVTDDAGEFSVKLGDHANYYLRVETPLGNLPEEAGKVTQIISAEDAVADKVFSLEWKVAGSFEDWFSAGDLPRGDEQAGYIHLEFEAQADWAAIIGRNAITGATTYHPANLPDAAWLLDDSSQKDGHFAFDFRLPGGSTDLDLDTPWTLMLVPESAGKEAVFSGVIHSWYIPTIAPDGDTDMDDTTDGDEPSDGDEPTDGDSPEDGDTDVDGDEDTAEADTVAKPDDEGNGCRHTDPATPMLLALTILLLGLSRRRLHG